MTSTPPVSVLPTDPLYDSPPVDQEENRMPPNPSARQNLFDSIAKVQEEAEALANYPEVKRLIRSTAEALGLPSETTLEEIATWARQVNLGLPPHPVPTASELGRHVRQVWVRFHAQKPGMKPSHLEPYEALSADDQAVDDQIGSVLFWMGAAHGHDMQWRLVLDVARRMGLGLTLFVSPEGRVWAGLAGSALKATNSLHEALREALHVVTQAHAADQAREASILLRKMGEEPVRASSGKQSFGALRSVRSLEGGMAGVVCSCGGHVVRHGDTPGQQVFVCQQCGSNGRACPSVFGSKGCSLLALHGDRHESPSGSSWPDESQQPAKGMETWMPLAEHRKQTADMQKACDQAVDQATHRAEELYAQVQELTRSHEAERTALQAAHAKALVKLREETEARVRQEVVNELVQVHNQRTQEIRALDLVIQRLAPGTLLIR